MHEQPSALTAEPAFSPDYAQSIDDGGLPCQLRMFPIQDYGIPDDRDAFRSMAEQMARDLIDGRRLLIHCGAGIGRTGTLATVVLLALHEPLDAADQAVRAVGSGPEDAKQEELIRWCSRAMLQAPRP